jgi:hypothetical protein
MTALTGDADTVGLVYLDDPMALHLGEKAIAYGQASDITMPASQQDYGAYVVAHEYGHSWHFSQAYEGGRPATTKAASDLRLRTQALYSRPEVRSSLSRYGQTMSEEGVAEAFAEWTLTGGQTDNVAAQAYARMLKWGGTA